MLDKFHKYGYKIVEKGTLDWKWKWEPREVSGHSVWERLPNPANVCFDFLGLLLLWRQETKPRVCAGESVWSEMSPPKSGSTSLKAASIAQCWTRNTAFPLTSSQPLTARRKTAHLIFYNQRPVSMQVYRPNLDLFGRAPKGGNIYSCEQWFQHSSSRQKQAQGLSGGIFLQPRLQRVQKNVTTRDLNSQSKTMKQTSKAKCHQ